MNTKEAYNTWADSYDTVENPTRTLDEKVVKSLLTDLRGKDIVEAGCGTGKNSLWFAEKGTTLKAFDFSEEMIEIAKKKVRNKNAEFIIQDITKRWVYEDKSCDVVSINLILEHIENLNNIFLEAYRILRQNGLLFVCELHPAKQEKGTVARFMDENSNKEIRLISYHHSKKDFEVAGRNAGFSEINFQDWYDQNNTEIPRLLSIMLTK